MTHRVTHIGAGTRAGRSTGGAPPGLGTCVLCARGDAAVARLHGQLTPIVVFARRDQIQGLDGEDDPIDVETAWRHEIASRVHEIESGTVELEDGPAVMSRLRERARARLDRRGS